MSKSTLTKAAEPARPNPMLAALAGITQPPATPTKIVAVNASPAISEQPAPPVPKAAEEKQKPSRRSARPSRKGLHFMGGYFPQHILKAMSYVMVEERRTKQELMEEAVNDFLIRKGQGKRLTPK